MLIEAVERLSRRQKQAIAMTIDTVMLPLLLGASLVVRHGHWNLDWPQFWPAFAVALVAVPLFAKIGLYRHIIRYMGSQALLVIGYGVAIQAVLLLAVAFMVRLEDFPRTIPFIFGLLAFVYLVGTRFLVRFYADSVVRNDEARRPVAIYGADDPGAYLAYLLARDPEYRPVAFIDDDPRHHDHAIHGIKVYPVTALLRLVDEHVVDQVLVVAPASPEERRRIIQMLEPYPIHVRLIPNVDAIIAGENPTVSIREVDVSDLLGRDQVAPLPHLMRGSVANRVVLVTGAGGSIGSELCRQILPLGPQALVILDQSEYALYQVENELKRVRDREGYAAYVVAVLGSVLDGPLMERTMRGYAVDTVYHAAAYKHVNLVENNVIQGIKNNTFGTLRAAEAALATEVADFILISTDKAVRTRNVMGASKRLAEMVLQAFQQRTSRTRFSTVRFGNVLVSSGSVVPLFLEQIDKGGPVTVTHRDATRYFMTISEAAELVLQAASMATGGDVFVLDMGEPVSILELAKKTIRLKGYKVRDETTQHGDITITFTGLRAGEKLNEELLVGDTPFGTEHRKIMRAVESHLPWDELKPALANLEKACDTFDYDAIKTFIEGLLEGADLAQQLFRLPARANVLALPERPTAGDQRPRP